MPSFSGEDGGEGASTFAQPESSFDNDGDDFEELRQTDTALLAEEDFLAEDNTAS